MNEEFLERKDNEESKEEQSFVISGIMVMWAKRAGRILQMEGLRLVSCSQHHR